MNEKRIKMQRSSRWGILAWLIPVLFILSCSKPSPEGGTNTAGQQRPSESDRKLAVASVRIQEVKLGSLELSTQATGILRSRYQVPLSAEIGGQVLKKYRDIGDAVAAGDAIVLLDPEPFELALLQAQAGEASAQVAHDQAARNYQRSQKLRESSDISEFELENSHLAERTSRANLQMAQAALRLAERNLRLTQLTSPVNGHVADLNAQIGQQVERGAPIGLVVSLDQMEIEISLSESEIGYIKTGAEAHISTDVYPGSIFEGAVRSCGVAGLEPGKTFPIVISVANHDRRLKPGMSARVQLIYAQPTNTICIPRDAVIMTDPTCPAVFVIREERALRRPIRLGEGNADQVIVESGLNPGDQVVIEGQNALQDSASIRIL
jgi:RND family efflux transporter MFP subunit